MRITFEQNFPSKHQGEIDEVLRRISVGKGPGQWPTAPDRIHVLRTISGGRSGCDVIEIRVERGNQQSLKVVKIGPTYSVAGEYNAFKSHLSNCGRHFTRIEAVTPGVLSKRGSSGLGREAIVYDHAQQFLAGSTCRTFEEVARQAIEKGGDDLHRAIDTLQDLFKGLQNDLYSVTESVGKSIDLYAFWNQRLGIAATIEVDRFDSKTKSFYRGPVTSTDLKQSKSNPRALMNASAQVDSELKTGELIYLENIRLEWWEDGRLIGEFKYGPAGVRFELVAPDNDLIKFVPKFDSNHVFSICGKLRGLRTSTTRERLLEQLTEIEDLEEMFISPDFSRTTNPFSILATQLQRTPAGRFTSIVHGDLNPRNILVVEKLPCLIDYAHTRKGAPLMLDFVTLETCLAREALPHDLTWAQHLRLQRLLAAAWRLGNQPNEFFSLLPEKLSSAFKLLSTVRAAAHEVYALHAPNDLHEWYPDYMENLFLFAHSTLKWKGDSAATRASAAIACVATECIEAGAAYEYWNRNELLKEGVEIAQRLTRFIEEPPPKLGARSKNVALAELAALSSGFFALRLRPMPTLPRLRKIASNEQPLESARVAFVRKEFFHLANDVLERRGRDHRQYIQLHAYIDLKGLVRETNERQDVLQVFASHPAIVLLGDAGGGKTTCAGEWEYCLARAIHPDIDEPPSIPAIADHPQMPIIVWAPALKRGLTRPHDNSPEAIVSILRDAVTAPPEEASLGRTINVLREKLDVDQLALDDLLTAGALHLTVDGLNEVEPGDKQLIANWIVGIRELFPRTSVVACHRKFSYIENLFPRHFRVVELEKVSEEQAKGYIRRIFGAAGQGPVGERLIQTIFQSTAEAVRDLAQTPLFLWMIVELYRSRQLPPTGRGQLFKEFAQWYMEGEHRRKRGVPSNPLYRYSYEEKIDMLRHIGFALVNRQERTFSEDEIFSFVPHVSQEKLLEMLTEVKDSEMLFINDGEYCFLHHSFQEFFAAWHFFKTEARDRKAVREKVDMYDWHDTIRMSVVFADLAPDAMEEIVQRSLVVNPSLAASVLRDAEFPDERLIALFINTLVDELRNRNSGASAWQTSAAALAEFGNPTAIEALFAIAGDTNVTGESRAEVIRQVATLPNLTRFERQKAGLQETLVNVLTEVLRRSDEVAVVLIAAIDAVEKSQLTWLYTLLPSLIESKDANVGNSAMEVCRRLGLVLPSSYEIKQTRDAGTDLKQVHLEEDILRTRLREAEREIINQTNVSRMTQLNRRRSEILGSLASANNICLLLERRFRLGIDDEIKALIDRVVENTKDDKTPALEILRESNPSGKIINHWASLIRSADACTAAAAAHRLAALGERLPAKVVQSLLEVDLPPDRLCAVASLVRATNDRSLAGPLDELLEQLTSTVHWPDGIEAWVLLCKALYRLDRHKGNQRWIVATFRFFNHRLYATEPGKFPLAYVEHDFSRDDEELESLMKRDGEYAKAALYQYSFWSVAALLTADRITNPGHLDQKNLKIFHTLAEAEHDPHQQTRLACAAVQLHAVDLLPWITEIIKENRSLKTISTTIYFGNYGQYSEALLGAVLRAKGYLARLLRDQGSKDKAKLSHEELRSQYKSLSRSKDPKVMVGLTTALGFLGDWEPILTHLNQDYDYMLKAAHSVFDWWVPRLPDGTNERVRAAEWIATRLDPKTDLRPKERDTLRALHAKLCKELGRYIGPPQ